VLREVVPLSTSALLITNPLFAKVRFISSPCTRLTFTGGEPLSQPEFLGKILRKYEELGLEYLLHGIADDSGYPIDRLKQIDNLFIPF